MIVRFVALAALAASLGACATVTRGTTTEFTVDSTPPGAAVRTSSGFTCPATPCTFRMPRKDSFEVTVSKKGFRSQSAYVRSQVAGAGAAGLVGNVIVGGIIGMGVDAASGAMNDLNPNPLSIALEPADDASAASSVSPKASSPQERFQ